MSDDNMQPTETDQPKQTELVQVGQQTEQSQGSTDHSTGPARSPLGARTQAAVRKLNRHIAMWRGSFGGTDFVCTGLSPHNS